MFSLILLFFLSFQLLGNAGTSVTEKFEHVMGETGSFPHFSFGTRGLWNSTNNPPGRYYGGVWKVKESAVLFGGRGFDESSTDQRTALKALDDVWEFNFTSTLWRFVKGGRLGNQARVVEGEVGEYNETNTPGGIFQFAHWSGELEEELYISMGASVEGDDNSIVNEMWVLNASSLEWKLEFFNESKLDCSYFDNEFGIEVSPPAVVEMSFIKLNETNVFIFGGYTKACVLGQPSSDGLSSHLWEFDMRRKMYRHVKGNANSGDIGRYGNLSVAHMDNIPPSRKGSHVWFWDGKLYLFGGISTEYLEDLWTFSDQMWTHIGGARLGEGSTATTEDYIFTPTVSPSARQGGIMWSRGGYLYLYGGMSGSSSVFDANFHTDLFVFSTSLNMWKLESGVRTMDQDDDIGQQIPAARAYTGGIVEHDEKIYVLGSGMHDFDSRLFVSCDQHRERRFFLDGTDCIYYYNTGYFAHLSFYTSTNSPVKTSWSRCSDQSYTTGPFSTFIGKSDKTCTNCDVGACTTSAMFVYLSYYSERLYYFTPSVWSYGGFDCMDLFHLDSPAVCSGHSCTTVDVCSCNNGTTGDICQCPEAKCAHGGQCEGKSSNCTCFDFWDQPNCTSCVDGYEMVNNTCEMIVADTDGETESETISETEEETVADTNAETVADTEDETDAETLSETEDETEDETNAETIADTNVDTDAETGVDTDAETIADTNADTNADTDAETLADTTEETLIDTDAETIPDETLADITFDTTSDTQDAAETDDETVNASEEETDDETKTDTEVVIAPGDTEEDSEDADTLGHTETLDDTFTETLAGTNQPSPSVFPSWAIIITGVVIPVVLVGFVVCLIVGLVVIFFVFRKRKKTNENVVLELDETKPSEVEEVVPESVVETEKVTKIPEKSVVKLESDGKKGETKPEKKGNGD